MGSIVLMVLGGALLFAVGVFASAWHFGRKFAALQDHLRAVKQLHADMNTQMKHQIGQLQAELEARKAAQSAPHRAPDARPAPRPARAAVASPQIATTREERAAMVDAMLANGGFGPTEMVGADGFPVTEVMT